MATDSYLTLSAPGEGKVTEKMSRFLSFAHPVTTAEEARAIVKEYANKYCDSRHVCWAYMLGPKRTEYQLNDNGEPSGTAGKPILGQINSLGLTDVVVVVVRYFGGIKLGTPGLIAAYRAAAREALENATIVERHQMEERGFTFPYLSMNEVMKVLKSTELEVLEQTFDNTCRLRVAVRADMAEAVFGRLLKIDGLTAVE